MGTASATGQAAGTVGALKALTGQDPDPEQVRNLLLSHGALLDQHNLVKAGHVEEPTGLNLNPSH